MTVKETSSLLIQERIKKLCENTDFVSTLLESLIGYAVIAADVDGNIIAFNEGARQIYGYAPDEVIGKQSIEKFFARDSIEAGQLQRIVNELIENKRFSYEGERVRRNGESFTAHLLYNLTRDKSDKVVGFIELAEDLTEQKQAEEALRCSETRYRRLFEAARDGILILNAESGQIEDANPFLLELLGYSKEYFLGKTLWDIGAFKDVEVAKVAFTRLQNEHYIRYENIPLEAKDGKMVSVEFVSNVYEVDQTEVIQCNIRDITERKKMEQQLLINDRLASIGELVSGIAHEISNPLTSVIGFSELVLGKDAPDDVKEDLKIIHSESERAGRIINGLLTFARKHTPDKQPMNIYAVLEGVLELRAYEDKTNNIQINTQFAADLPEIVGDSFQLQQAFLNIVINAEHFMFEAHNRGTLNIICEKVENTVRVLFIDDGPGITKENLTHIFDPFFTMKEVGKGTGLGLSISHGIIAGHGGKLYAESELGKGSTFVVELPVRVRS